jgi:hypothetical protein
MAGALSGLSPAIAAWLFWAAVPLAGQTAPPVRAYLLNVGLWADAGASGAAAVFDLQRARLMASPTAGPLRLELAWETFVTLTSRAGAAPFGATLGSPSSAEWLPLQGTISSGRHGSWRHRLDRLSLRYATPLLELTAGRQAISWATTLLLTPADPFAPFDPSDPFREYRAGVDAVRLQVTPGPFVELEGAARMADTPAGRKATAALRAHATVQGVELSGWGGVLFDEPAGAFAATVTAAGAALRGEVELRRVGRSTVVRGAVGADRSWQVAGRTLYLVGEYQHDGLGATAAADLPAVLGSPAAARGELQVLGRDEIAGQGTYQIHPLIRLELLGLADLQGSSALLAPAVSWSATQAATVRAGAFIGLGKAGSAAAPGSEYGPVPLTLYASLAVFL